MKRKLGTHESNESHRPPISNRTIATILGGVLTAGLVGATLLDRQSAEAPRQDPIELLSPRERAAWDRAQDIADSINATAETKRPASVTVLNGYIRSPHPKRPDHEVHYQYPVSLESGADGKPTVQRFGMQGDGKNGEVRIIPYGLADAMEVVLNDPDNPFITVEVMAVEQEIMGHHLKDHRAVATDPSNPESSTFAIGTYGQQYPLSPEILSHSSNALD